LHNSTLNRSLYSESIVEFKDGAITETNEKVAIEEVKGARERRRDVDELNELEGAIGCCNDANAFVFATRDQMTLCSLNCSDS